VIARTSPVIGPELAASCVGKMIHHNIREDGLRCGGGSDPSFVTLAGFIESADCDAYGVVASLLVLSPVLDWDLKDLEASGELESARLCLEHSALAIPRKTAWGVKVFDITRASANHLNFTSLAHSPATHVLRRLGPDEPLSAKDFGPTAWLHVPPTLSILPADELPAARIDPGAVSEQTDATASSTTSTSSNLSTDIDSMSTSLTPASGEFIIVTLKMRELRIANLHSASQNVIAFLEITDGSNSVIADDHWTFPLSAAGGGADFVVVPVHLIAFVTAAGGSVTYKGRWRVTGDVNTSNVQILNSNSRRLQITRLKR
jgi:hypothetical protein